MASVELGETEEIAKQYCNGNLSNFLRSLIIKYHNEQMEQNKQDIVNDKIGLFQNFMFLFLGITFFVLAIGSIIDIFFAINLSLLICSGVFLSFYSIINIFRFKQRKVVNQ